MKRFWGGFAEVASYADVVKRGAPVGDDSYNYLDLTPLLEADPDFNSQDFWPGMLESCSVDDRTLGLPVAGRPNLIVFDGAAFDAAGLTRPAPGWAWQDFETAVATLTQTSGEEVLRYGFVDTGWPLTLLAPRLDAILTSSPGDPDLSTLQSELDWFVSLANKVAIHTLPSEGGHVDLEELIHNRQVAMWVESSVGVSTRLAALGNDGGVAPYPIPSADAAARSTWVNAEYLLVSAGTANPLEAWEWVQFLASQRLPSPAQACAVPARPSVADEGHYWDLLDEPVAAAFRFALENAWYGSISREPLNSIGQALSQAMRGESTLAAALAEIQTDPPAPPPPAAATPMAVATPQPPSAAATPPPGAVVIDFFYHGNDYTSLEAVEAVVDAFHQENPEIFVRLIDWESAFRMDQGFNAITLAERFDCFTTTIPPIESGFDNWYSLNPLIEADLEGPAIFEEIPAGWLEFPISRGDGILYAIPLAAQPHVIYFNKDLLESMGLQPPDPNWTMDDFWALATGAASQNIYGFVHKSDHNFFFEWKSLFPLWDFSVSPERINFDSPETLATVSFLVDMAEMRAIAPITPGSPRNDWLSGYHTRYHAISAGKAAMWTDYAGNIHDAYTFPDGLPFEIGLVPLPADIPPQWATQTIQFYISRQAENPEACWEWMKFLSSQPVIFQGIPLRSSVLASPDLEAFLGVETAAAYRAFMARPVREFVICGEPFNSVPLFWWWNETLTDIFNGADPQRALTELRQKAEVYSG